MIFLSLITGFLEPYEKKFVDIIMLYCVKLYLEDISSIESFIFYRFRAKTSFSTPYIR